MLKKSLQKIVENPLGQDFTLLIKKQFWKNISNTGHETTAGGEYSNTMLEKFSSSKTQRNLFFLGGYNSHLNKMQHKEAFWTTRDLHKTQASTSLRQTNSVKV